MPNIITVTTNSANFTIAYNSIQQDWGFNELSYFLNSSDNRFIDIIERSTDTRKYRMDVTEDTIDVNGTTTFADAAALADALRAAMFSTTVGTGQVGLDSFDWKFSTDTTNTDPTQGFVKFNNAVVPSVTSVYMSSTNGANDDGTPFILSLTVGDTILISQDSEQANFALFQVSAAVIDNTTWFEIPCVPISYGSDIEDQADIGIQFTYTGTATSGGVQTVSGDGVDNTDPANPVMALAAVATSGLYQDLNIPGPSAAGNVVFNTGAGYLQRAIEINDVVLLSVTLGNLSNDIGTVQSNLNDHENNTSNPHGVTADQVGLFTPAYVELFRGTKGTQLLPGGGQVISFDAAGINSGVTVDLPTSKVTIVTAGTYEITLMGAVDLDSTTDYAIDIRLNGANVRQVTNMEGAGAQKPTIAGSAILNLSVNDEVQLWADPTGVNKEFELEIGTAFRIKRIG